MPYSWNPPPLRKFLGRLQGLTAGVNTDRTYTRHGEAKNVAAGVELLVGGTTTPAEGMKLHQVTVYGTAPATWTIYIGGSLRRTQNTNAAQQSLPIPFGGVLTAPFESIEVKVQHDESTVQDFTCDLDLEEAPLARR